MNYQKYLSVVLYIDNNKNFDIINKTFESIEKQNLNHLFVDVVILNDNKSPIVSKEINDYLVEKSFVNYKIVSFEDFTGMPLCLEFAIKNKVIKSKYFTLIQSGDTYEEGWINEFLEKVYPLNPDMFVSNIYDHMMYETTIKNKKTNVETKTVMMKKSRHFAIDALTGEVSKEEVLSTKPYFLGKVFKTIVASQLKVKPNAVLYQSFFIYFQLVLMSKSFYFLNKMTGTMVHKEWIPETMTDVRIELLCSTVDDLIKLNNPFVNWLILEMLANAIERTPSKLLSNYIIKAHEKLVPYIQTPKRYNLSNLKVKKTTKSIVEKGLVVNAKKSKK